MTPQQLLLREANEACGIRKGISRTELVDKLRNCLPEFYRARREAKAAAETPPATETKRPD